jgi:formylmethanofuran dehydrogenase subunit B
MHLVKVIQQPKHRNQEFSIQLMQVLNENVNTRLFSLTKTYKFSPIFGFKNVDTFSN